MQPPERVNLSFSGLEEGIPRGALSQFCGPWGGGKTEFLLRFLREHPRERVAWIEEHFSSYPVAFEQKGVYLDQLLFVDVGEVLHHAVRRADPLSIALQVLASQLFGIVVLHLELTRGEGSALQLRRLQLAAERSCCAVILLNEEPVLEGRWPLALQLEIKRKKLDEEGGGELFSRLLKGRRFFSKPESVLLELRPVQEWA